MADYYLAYKHLHMMCAYLSIAFLLFRIYLSIKKPALLDAKWAKYTPMAIDTLLLVAATLMIMVIGAQHPFVLVKIIMVCIYVLLDYCTIRVAQKPSTKLLLTVLIIAVFLFTVGVGVSKSPASWWGIEPLD